MLFQNLRYYTIRNNYILCCKREKKSLRIEGYQGGFTLIELLIVMALTAILWAIAYAMFYQSKGLFSLCSNKLEMYQQARIAMDNISRDLKGAVIKDDRDFFVSFGTQSASSLSPATNTSILLFLTLAPNGSSTPATLVAYYLNNTGELMKAEFYDTSYVYGTVSGITPGSATYYKLTTNTNLFNLDYYTKGTWVAGWNSTGDPNINGTTTGTGKLPDAVRVTLQMYGTNTSYISGKYTENIQEIGTFTSKIMLPCQN